jgi:hypothetical protein
MRLGEVSSCPHDKCGQTLPAHREIWCADRPSTSDFVLAETRSGAEVSCQELAMARNPPNAALAPPKEKHKASMNIYMMLFTLVLDGTSPKDRKKLLRLLYSISLMVQNASSQTALC